MKAEKKGIDWDLQRDIDHKFSALLPTASWVLRITEMKDKPSPVLVIKERAEDKKDKEEAMKLYDRGIIYGQSYRRCLPIIRLILNGVSDNAGIPLELQRIFAGNRVSFRGNLPLNQEAGAKLAIMFKLQERMGDINRIELIAWRVERFTREEAVYWWTRATQYGEAASRWAQSGMRIMLGGQPKDPEIENMLEQLRK